MQPKIVLVPLAGTGLDLTGVDLLADRDSHLGPHRRAVHLGSITPQGHAQPALFADRVLEQLPATDQVQGSVVVEVRPGGLVSRRKAGHSGLGTDVGHLECPVVAEQHRVVLAAK